MRTIVIDSSVAAAWFLPDEKGEYLDILRDFNDYDVHVPLLFFQEVLNAFLSAERRGRVTAQHNHESLSVLMSYRLIQDYQPNESGLSYYQALLSLAQSSKLTIYDATYLNLRSV